MAYLNPSSFRVDEKEVLTAAKFAAWASEDKAMRDATVRVSVGNHEAKNQGAGGHVRISRQATRIGDLDF